MATPVPSDIEREFARLSREAQLRLLERLQRHVQAAVSSSESIWESEVSAMAADPQIRAELDAISSEFTATEADGLEKH